MLQTFIIVIIYARTFVNIKITLRSLQNNVQYMEQNQDKYEQSNLNMHKGHSDFLWNKKLINLCLIN